MNKENGIMLFKPFLTISVGIAVLFVGKRLNDAIPFLRTVNRTAFECQVSNVILERGCCGSLLL